jgi:hypothetical protein
VQRYIGSARLSSRSAWRGSTLARTAAFRSIACSRQLGRMMQLAAAARSGIRSVARKGSPARVGRRGAYGDQPVSRDVRAQQMMALLVPAPDGRRPGRRSGRRGFDCPPLPAIAGHRLGIATRLAARNARQPRQDPDPRLAPRPRSPEDPCGESLLTDPPGRDAWLPRPRRCPCGAHTPGSRCPRSARRQGPATHGRTRDSATTRAGSPPTPASRDRDQRCGWDAALRRAPAPGPRATATA